VDGAVDDIPGQDGLAAAVLAAGWHARDEYQNRPGLTSQSGSCGIRVTIDTDWGVVYVYSGMRLLYLTVYMDPRGDVRSHVSPHPLGFLREVQGARGEMLYRAVIDGTIVEDDGNPRCA
jgi:hypothetical protein